MTAKSKPTQKKNVDDLYGQKNDLLMKYKPNPEILLDMVKLLKIQERIDLEKHYAETERFINSTAS